VRRPCLCVYSAGFSTSHSLQQGRNFLKQNFVNAVGINFQHESPVEPSDFKIIWSVAKRDDFSAGHDPIHFLWVGNSPTLVGPRICPLEFTPLAFG
jgi:hypothetical protein